MWALARIVACTSWCPWTPSITERSVSGWLWQFCISYRADKHRQAWRSNQHSTTRLVVLLNSCNRRFFFLLWYQRGDLRLSTWQTCPELRKLRCCRLSSAMRAISFFASQWGGHVWPRPLAKKHSQRSCSRDTCSDCMDKDCAQGSSSMCCWRVFAWTIGSPIKVYRQAWIGFSSVAYTNGKHSIGKACTAQVWFRLTWGGINVVSCCVAPFPSSQTPAITDTVYYST